MELFFLNANYSDCYKMQHWHHGFSETRDTELYFDVR